LPTCRGSHSAIECIWAVLLFILNQVIILAWSLLAGDSGADRLFCPCRLGEIPISLEVISKVLILANDDKIKDI